jgi:hypothetical protein
MEVKPGPPERGSKYISTTEGMNEIQKDSNYRRFKHMTRQEGDHDKGISTVHFKVLF